MSKNVKKISLFIAIFAILTLALGLLTMLIVKNRDELFATELLFTVWLVGYLAIMPIIGWLWVKLKTADDKLRSKTSEEIVAAYGEKLLKEENSEN